MSIRVVIADDHQLFREGLIALLTDAGRFTVLAQARDGREAIAAVQRSKPDVVLMDVAMAEFNGIEATRRITKICTDTRVLGLSSYINRDYVWLMLDAGALGYVSKFAAPDELIYALQQVAHNKPYLSRDLVSALNGMPPLSRNHRPPAGSPSPVLGPREREVLQLIAEGKTSPQVAASLHIAVKTVESHRQHIMEKLDLHNIADLTKYAVRMGLTSLEI